MPIFLETNVQRDQSCNLCQGKVKFPKKQVSASPMALEFSNHCQNIGLGQVLARRPHILNNAKCTFATLLTLPFSFGPEIARLQLCTVCEAASAWSGVLWQNWGSKIGLQKWSMEAQQVVIQIFNPTSKHRQKQGFCRPIAILGFRLKAKKWVSKMVVFDPPKTQRAGFQASSPPVLQSVRLRRPGLGYFGKIEDQKSALKNGRWRPSKSWCKFSI